MNASFNKSLENHNFIKAFYKYEDSMLSSHVVSLNSVRSINRYVYISIVLKIQKNLLKIVAFFKTLHVSLHILCEIKLNELIKAEKYSKSVFWIYKKLHDAVIKRLKILLINRGII